MTKKILNYAGIILTGLFLFLTALIGFGSVWGLTKWGKIDLDEIIFQLQSPLEGTESGILNDYFLKGLLPAVLLFIFYIIAQILLAKQKRKNARKRFTASVAIISLIACLGIFRYVWTELQIGEWLAAQNSNEDFVADHYVDPASVELTFPEKKRNLIYIYLESMESTYASETAGGLFPESLIPELEKIAQENEDFSGKEDLLQGGYSYNGTTYTTAGIFAQSTGLPLRVSIGGNNMDTQDSFFPDITALGDILQDQGYRQIFMCGSDATFGGRRLYFQDHGNFEIMDHPYAIEQGLLPSDYNVFWGYEDEKLFEFAKNTLTELAGGDQPFNFTMLTVDTHFPDGYVCDLCENHFPDNQYANVMACSSRQLAAFVSWIQKQDFYENTTLVLCGDHPTMSTRFEKVIKDTDERKAYTAYINSAVEPKNPEKRRAYSTMDDFPTTLASLGVSIPGDRLALGTNLFSDVQTLTEEFGYEKLERKMKNRSAFLQELEKADDNSERLYERYREEMVGKLTLESYDPGTGRLDIKMQQSFNDDPAVESYTAVCRETGSENVERVMLKEEKKAASQKEEDEDPVFSATLNISGWENLDGDVTIEMNLKDGNVVKNLTTAHVSPLAFLHDDPAAYLRYLKKDPAFSNVSILFAVKDDATKYLTEETVAAMEAFGMKTARETAGQSRISWLGVIEPGKVQEKAGYEKLTLEGTLQDGNTDFSIVSGGKDNGNTASIQINDVDYAKNHRGLDIVIYDTTRQQVIDTVLFKINKP